jgi:two-component system, chemotaxis family, sensor kinase CheA
MDTRRYLPMFLAETREHLEQLNLAVVRIEEQPGDRETVDEIFRRAHSMKGMSATMGFEAMAALTHAMEDVFELLRQRAGGLDREAIDALLRCLDALTAAIDAIETEGAERLDPAPLVEQLRGLVRERTPEQQRGGEAVLQARCTLADDALIPSVRAYMVLAAAAELGEIVVSSPREEDVEGFDGPVIELSLSTAAEADVLGAALAEVPDIASVDVTEHAPASTPSPSTPAAARAAATVRVDAERLDQLMHLMGELVVQRTRVEALAAQADVPGLGHAVQELTRCSHGLQAMVMQVRMIPVEAVFLRLPRLVRDLAARLGKQAELKLAGQETELDRTVVDALGDPLVHLVRNALDHGLEAPDVRDAAGKPATGTVAISARHAGGNVVITVSDDGAGVNAEAVARAAVERGLVTAEEAASVDPIELLFTPGFSTARTMSDISGRGVGMDVVRAKVRELGGDVTMTSEPGRGTTTQIRLPLTLAILSALLVEAGGRSYAIAIDRVDRTVRLADHTVRSAAGRRVLVVGDEVLSLLDASGALGHEPGGETPFAVIVRSQERSVALAVSALVGQRELVMRPLPADVAGLAAVSGAAVLSDGDIALLVDCDDLLTDELRLAA